MEGPGIAGSFNNKFNGGVTVSMSGLRVNIRNIFSPSVTAILFICILLIAGTVNSADKQPIKIGVLAYKGKAEAGSMWNATASYLNSSIQGYDFRIVPLNFHEIEPAVRSSDIDFLIANSSIYVEMEAKYGVTRIATMKNRGLNGSYTQFGGTIFCRTDRNDIQVLTDLKGKSFLAVDETSLGGWQAAWGELQSTGIDPHRNFSSLGFTGNHEAIVIAVKDGKTDAGTVRTDTLERMAEKGRIRLDEFRVLNPQHHPDFPFLTSTRLYPEWPIARIRNVPEDISKKIVTALLYMPEESPAARDAKITGWTIPLDYNTVHDLLKKLRLSPYKDYGKTSLKEAARQYWYMPLLTVIIIFVMASVIMHILKLNRHILAAKLEAVSARNGLEQKVEERTAELRGLNLQLEDEIKIRLSSELKLKEAEHESREQTKFLQAVIDSVSDPIMVIAPDYVVKLSNSAARENSGRDTFCYAISHNQTTPCSEGECPCPLKEVMRTRSSATMVHNHLNKNDNSESIVEIHASPVFDGSGNVIYVIEICRDITEKVRSDQQKKRDDERMFLQQKEESIATLAGGIAHDFNNILMGILGNAELLKLRLPLTENESRPLDNIIASVDRMADLTKQLLAYAKGGKYQPAVLDMSEIINESLNLSHKGQALKVRTVLEISGDIWPVMGDKGQIVQSLVNLLNNAFETLEKSGGEVKVTAENSPSMKTWTCSMQHEHPAGDYVRVTVSDNGPGIPESISGKIFEPFFSTKFLGRGLGLSAALGIIVNHSGCISFESSEGRGTTFQILLPRAERSVRAAESRPERAAAKEQPGILIVDDEEHILQLLRDALISFGYRVYAMESGEKAIEFLKDRVSGITAVILDLQMPGMSGKEAFGKIKTLIPDARIIISTGYDRSIAMEEIKPHIPEGFIQKPYRISALQKTLRSLLEPTS